MKNAKKEFLDSLSNLDELNKKLKTIQECSENKKQIELDSFMELTNHFNKIFKDIQYMRDYFKETITYQIKINADERQYIDIIYHTIHLLDNLINKYYNYLKGKSTLQNFLKQLSQIIIENE